MIPPDASVPSWRNTRHGTVNRQRQTEAKQVGSERARDGGGANESGIESAATAEMIEK